MLTASTVVKWDGLAFGAFPGCVTRCFTFTSRFLPHRPAKVTIYAPRCHHFLSFFLLFSGVKRISGYVRPQKIVAIHPLKRGKRRPHLWAALGGAFGLGQPSCGVVTKMAFKCSLRMMQTLNLDTAADLRSSMLHTPFPRKCKTNMIT